jgi:hypothetical protein
MRNVSDVRRTNIRALVDERGGLSKLSRALGYKNPSFLSQMTSVAGPTREVTERTARRIEEALGLPTGYLDQVHDVPVRAPRATAPDIVAKTPTGVLAADVKRTPVSDESVQFFVDVVRAVGAACDEAGVNLAPGKFADLILMVVSDSAERGAPREDRVKQLVHLLR